MSRTILLADDSLTIQKVVELTFADTDYQVVAVSSGDELLLQLPECRPDLVICDVKMPDMNGDDVCQEIKSNPGTLHLPLILLTGTFEPFDRDRALAAGCSEIITKPFEARKLVEAVERLAGKEASEAQPDTAEPAAMEHEGQLTPPPPAAAPDAPTDVGFGTHLADTAAPPEGLGEEIATDAPEELDFTASGFAEMEEAGRLQQEARFEAPEEGLEFELGGEPEDAGEVLVEPPAVETSADTGPLPESLSVTPEDLSMEDVAEVMSEASGEPFGEYQEFESEEVPASPEEIEEVSFGAFDEVAELPPEPEDDPLRKTAPIEAMAALSGEEESWEEATPEVEEALPTDDTSEIDTQDITEDAARLVDAGGDSLTDEDVDRIAHRLLELAKDRIEHIAWDVIPDMAELVVRERVREIEAEAGEEPTETVQ